MGKVNDCLICVPFLCMVTKEKNDYIKVYSFKDIIRLLSKFGSISINLIIGFLHCNYFLIFKNLEDNEKNRARAEMIKQMLIIKI